MSYFTTRVELHDAKETDYETLHAVMAKQGFSRTIQKTGEPVFKLPTAEYNKHGDFTANHVLELAKIAATTTKKKFAVLVTKSEEGRAWFGLKEA